ncbi:protein RRP5 homolog [Pararge aegeria]|nr:protein RRP5 homolog [Pararge aegeria]
MADTEDYFPRGGKKPTTTYFKQNENFLGGTEKGERKKKKLKKRSEEDDGDLSDELVQEVDQSYKICGIWLNYKVVKEGQLLLGRVRQVKETSIHICLPCRTQGIVMACHISEAYNKMLEAFINDQIEKVCELPQMFRPGQYVAVKILEVQDNNLMLSMMPQHINSARTFADLHKGALLQAAVSSVEDHGYVMDIGIPNARAFLPIGSTNPEIELDVGVLTWVAVRELSAESGVVTLNSELEGLQKAVQRKPAALLPGTALEFTVDKPLDNGIEGHILDNKTAYIQRNQVDTVRGKKPGLGHKIRARLLYMVQPNNIPFLTMKNIFETTYPDLAQEQKFNNGDIIEEAKVIKIVGRSIHFKLGEGSLGQLSLRRVTIHEDLTDEQVLLKSYPIGSTHKVRILSYNLSDYVYSVSDDPTLLAQKYFNLSQLHIGDEVVATITAVADNILNVTVGRINGIVPQLHMSETGIVVDPKKASNSKLPKKKFKVDQEVKARVLCMDFDKQRVILTLKPSLLDQELEILQSYDTAAVGKAYKGVIVTIKEYLLVSFFNNVVAVIPKIFVSTAPLDNLTEAFHLGQILKCTIISVKPEEKKMCGSLTKAPFTPSEKQSKTTKRKIEDPGVVGKKQKTDHSIEIKKKPTKKDIKSNNDRKEVDIAESKEDIKKKKRSNKEFKEEQVDENNENVEIDTEEKNSKKKKKSKNKIDDETHTKNNKNKEENEKNIERVKDVKVLTNMQPAVELPSAKDFWSLDTDVIADKTKDVESSSSEEEEEDKPKKKRKKLTVAEKATKAREEEERIREMEKRAIESENAPRSSDQFERALLAQPDCSQLWIAYMAFHLQATEIDKARAVGRKALNTINFREEGEKLNVWLALLNLEHRFGNKESQQKTLEDALQMNDTYEIHSKLLDILVDTSKPQELVALVELMMRKYRKRAGAYTACGEACFKAALLDKARQVMQKGIAAFERKEHVSLLVRFAQLERSHGDRERSEALFEQVLAVYPQRVDVCSAYLDILLKAKDIERVRQLMERMTSLQLPARKMKVLYKKWIEVETKIGDAAHVESIRQRAIQFIDKAKF